jgi:hypothetical protein
MAEQPLLISRAQRLLTTSATAPLAILVVVATTMVLRGRPDSFYVFVAVISMIFAIVIVALVHASFRNPPEVWGISSTFDAIVVAFLLVAVTYKSPSDRRFGLETPTFSVVVVLLTLGILLLGWLPARRAARLVLDNLSSDDVVNSSLIIRFTSRPKEAEALCVTPDSLRIMRQYGSFKVERFYRLSAVSSVAVRTETDDGEFSVPGVKERLIRVTRGEVVVVELPEGDLVFPAKDVQGLKRFIEERARRAVVAEDGRWL